MCVCVRVCDVCAHARMYVCFCACMYVYMYVHMHVIIHMCLCCSVLNLSILNPFNFVKLTILR